LHHINFQLSSYGPAADLFNSLKEPSLTHPSGRPLMENLESLQSANTFFSDSDCTVSTQTRSSHATPARCRVTIVIKAFNEEKNICAAIESSLAAVAEVGGEVVLADSFSTDSTVELASNYPIRIVQLAHAHERCRGAGTQLGYQHSLGEYVYILNGNMRMLRGFLGPALTFLAVHPEAAGVGGRLVELDRKSLERERDLGAAAYGSPGDVDRLDGGGLYRRLAIEEAGYFSDRNLHSCEEFELAVRLRALGWKLWRIPVDSATHYGHEAPPYQLLMRRWRTGYVSGLGELIRASAGKPRMRLVLRGMRELRIYAAVLVWWVVLLTVAFWPFPAAARMAGFAALASAPVMLMLWRTRSLTRAVYSVASWCVNAAGLLRGLLHRRRAARDPIASKILREPPQATEPRHEHYA
jgi:glycosyltransferase involved in cell wall biosynthesis